MRPIVPGMTLLEFSRKARAREQRKTKYTLIGAGAIMLLLLVLTFFS
jgi:hypothetical protein